MFLNALLHNCRMFLNVQIHNNGILLNVQLHNYGMFLNVQIQHQYTLTDENGPAHNKTFFVKLKLGDEEYSAKGPSIKKAQHAAAEIALQHSKHKRPPNKQPKGGRKGE